jgi:hypothetical protein
MRDYCLLKKDCFRFLGRVRAGCILYSLLVGESASFPSALFSFIIIRMPFGATSFSEYA